MIRLNLRQTGCREDVLLARMNTMRGSGKRFRFDLKVFSLKVVNLWDTLP